MSANQKSGSRKDGKDRKGGAGRAPVLEWISAAVGLLLTLAILAAMGWEAYVGGAGKVPVIEARVERVVSTATGYVAEIGLDNHSPATAATVEIEGELTKPDGTTATSVATIDYVPGASTRTAGLFFTDDPRRGQLEVRVLGYAEP